MRRLLVLLALSAFAIASQALAQGSAQRPEPQPTDPPGEYYLIVGTSYRQEEAAYVNVTVDADVTLKVQTNAGARVSGRVCGGA